MSYFKELKGEWMVPVKVIKCNIMLKAIKQISLKDFKCRTLFSAALFLLIFLMLTFAGTADAGTYLNSAHGSSTSGVKRSDSLLTDYAKGHCAHCHEQHASIDGSEPYPTGGPDIYSLFETSHTSQTDNFCFECHTGVSSYQTGGSIVNRSYSYRAGAWTSDPVDDIKEMFSYSSPGTSHKLDDIMTFITGKWGYTSDSNPCNACHNPHAAQGDPLGAGSSVKSSGTRGYPVSRPSLHNNKDNNAWGLWGDEAGEKMSDYTSSYQAPNRYTTNLEPQGDADAATAAQNTTDFVTFCTDCHNTTNIIYSNTLLRDLKTINWTSSGDMHGGKAKNADMDKGTTKAPYNDGSSYVLSCLDCHEPHGSQNAYLLRTEVNGVVISNPISAADNLNSAWNEFCLACHDVTDTGAGFACAEGLHGVPFATSLCTECHTHGAGLCPAPPHAMF